MPFKVGTTPGLHYIARSPELATSVKKIGFVLTRGISTMELPLDIPHEITFTEAKKIRHIAKKQGLEMNTHGDLQIELGMPDRSDWRDAQDRIQKSIRSAVFMGSTYIVFHSTMTIWLELLTHGAGRKLTVSFCDHKGRFILDIFKDSKKLREWLVFRAGRMFDVLEHDILNLDERRRMQHKVSERYNDWVKEKMNSELRVALYGISDFIKSALAKSANKEISKKEVDDYIDHLVGEYQLRGIIPQTDKFIEQKMRNVIANVHDEAGEKQIEIDKEVRAETVLKKLEKGGSWFSEEIRGGSINDGYIIMANYLFLEKDPIWVAMTEEYKDLMKLYKLDYNDPSWLDRTLKEAQDHHDRDFKEFFYAVVAAKFAEGHMEATFKWMKNGLVKEINALPGKADEDSKFKEACLKTAKKLIIGIENPESRESHYAGSHLLWRPKQIYAAIKTIRKLHGLDRLMMIVDHEHLATQGVDALIESKENILTKKDFGSLVIAVHANHPNPMHSHETLEFGDTVLYELLYNLVVTGMGKDRTVFLIYERGGGDDPYQRSIDVLKTMAKFIEKQTPIGKLPLEFFGMESMAMGGEKRQLQIIEDHKMEPLKDLFEIPEEEWGILSSAAKSKGKAEVFKKGELK